MWTIFKDWWDTSDCADWLRYVWHMTRPTKYASFVAIAIVSFAYRFDVLADWAIGIASIVELVDIWWTRIIIHSADKRPEHWDKF